MTLYENISQEQINERIAATRKTLGKDLVVLAHYYQNIHIVRSADFVGDSLQLAQSASRQVDAKYMVFCAVSFMAEMARILCKPHQKVFHPELAAKCPLAEMAVKSDVEIAWEFLKGTGRRIIPVVYVNSRADLKAFCGKNEGFVCTSSNAGKVMNFVLSQGAVPLFFPDENLGRNTAHTMGITDDEMFLWEPFTDISQKNASFIAGKKVILWRGFCYVHVAFKPSDIEDVKKTYGDDINIIVHPECISDVVQRSDYVGSTSYIKNTVEAAPAGSKWAVGTEINFVNRIKDDNPDKLVVPLKEWGCREMAKVTSRKFLGVLENLVQGKPQPEVAVDPDDAKYAKIALERMLSIA
ncbi:MAG: quinolinate synthase NadA [Syntrophorhabdaceae bacterium]|nr:quinolinate synthase NadA [Syntrophorhabdaceae bacterium]MDD4196874.1 quinolinate synthase NadA [Syntrophorhabdaceae bacterium]HOC45218.1 quinolinate synthase NadA [Syntrophorhabdaceae bacterium]